MEAALPSPQEDYRAPRKGSRPRSPRRVAATDEDAEAQGGHRAAQGHTAGRAQSGDPPPGLGLLGKHCSLQASERQEPKEVRSK